MPIDAPAVSYVVVEDVAATWEQYAPIADALSGSVPSGLILHAAGPTDEGFRIVEVWQDEGARRRFLERFAPQPAGSACHVIRSLQPEHVIFGARNEERWVHGGHRRRNTQTSAEQSAPS